ncbi:MAG: CoA synthetase, partial [Rhizobiales bacterium]|nr:CoA synthetase [Hyphomicrobiales bacterium]
LARERSGGDLRVSILGSERHNPFTDGGVELFDCAAQGRIDAFFLGGGQIDGKGNINLVGVGDYPQSKLRWPGSFGSAFLYFMVPRVILFRDVHSPRVFVPKVDFISAPGTSPANVHRTGGPYALVTSKAVMDFDRQKTCFRLRSLHPGETLAELIGATGFAFEHDREPPTTPAPDQATRRLILGPIGKAVAETYPAFAARLAGETSA